MVPRVSIVAEHVIPIVQRGRMFTATGHSIWPNHGHYCHLNVIRSTTAPAPSSNTGSTYLNHEDRQPVSPDYLAAPHPPHPISSSTISQSYWCLMVLFKTAWRFPCSPYLLEHISVYILPS
ncbi:hypothetical protein PCANC_23091 [Puccinia coronata f. sp. avenae]|uniref:Uncharacterized protein n=1 Tax=Puccinia coronata f. sp. avenae TaxID=200324 RepID=A0A2N5U7D6_9BASI|nr:hypothetical protein PCANC_23091 [Puccinia coronata f. sp. avenae]